MGKTMVMRGAKPAHIVPPFHANYSVGPVRRASFAGQVRPVRIALHPGETLRFGRQSAGMDILWENVVIPIQRKCVDPIALKEIFEPCREMEPIHSPWLQRKVDDVYFPTTNGLMLHGWYIPPKPGMPTILYAHGNAGNISRGLDERTKMFRQRNIEALTQDKEGFGLLTFDYRGYGQSQGDTPTTDQELYQDYESALRFLVDEHRLDPSRDIVAVGESLGGSVVAYAATQVPFRAVMIFSTFTTMKDMIDLERPKQHLPIPPWLQFTPRMANLPIPSWVQVSPDMVKMFRTIDIIDQIRSPLLIAHGTQDGKIPIEMAEALHHKAVGSIYKPELIRVTGADHNDLFIQSGPELASALRQLIKNTRHLKIPVPNGHALGLNA